MLARAIRCAGVAENVWAASPAYIAATQESLDFVINYAKANGHEIVGAGSWRLQIWSGADSSILTEIGDGNAPNIARLLNRGYNHYETLWPLGGIAAGSIEAGINAEHLGLVVARQWAVAMRDNAKTIEVRSFACRKDTGMRIHILSGGERADIDGEDCAVLRIMGTAVFRGCFLYGQALAKSCAAEAIEWEESGQEDAFEADKAQHLVDAETFAKMLNKWSIQKGGGFKMRTVYGWRFSDFETRGSTYLRKQDGWETWVHFCDADIRGPGTSSPRNADGCGLRESSQKKASPKEPTPGHGLRSPDEPAYSPQMAATAALRKKGPGPPVSVHLEGGGEMSLDELAKGCRIRFMYPASSGNPFGEEGQPLLREATVLERLSDSWIQVLQTSCAGQSDAGVKTMKVERIRDLRVLKLPTASPSSVLMNSGSSSST